MKRRQRRPEVYLSRVQNDGRLDAAGPLSRRQENAVVGADEQSAAPRNEADVPSSRTNAGVHHDEVDCVGELIHARRRGGCALADVEGRDVVTQIHNPRVRTRADDDRVTHSHPGVVGTEVRYEADDRLHVASPSPGRTRIGLL